MLSYIVLSETLKPLSKAIIKPSSLDEETSNISIVVKGCPTRSFHCGADIYSFTWFLNLKKQELRNQNTIFLESEIPTAHQQH